MTLLLQAFTGPISDFALPIYCLSKGIKPKEKLAGLILTSLRTATVVALFFLTIPSNQAFSWIFGLKPTVSNSLTISLQFLIHPYAAALLNGFVNSPITQRVIHAVFKREMIFTQNDIGGCFLAVAFCISSPYFKDCTNRIDRKYMEWSANLALWFYKKPEEAAAVPD